MVPFEVPSSWRVVGTWLKQTILLVYGQCSRRISPSLLSARRKCPFDSDIGRAGVRLQMARSLFLSDEVAIAKMTVGRGWVYYVRVNTPSSVYEVHAERNRCLKSGRSFDQHRPARCIVAGASSIRSNCQCWPWQTRDYAPVCLGAWFGVARKAWRVTKCR